MQSQLRFAIVLVTLVAVGAFSGARGPELQTPPPGQTAPTAQKPADPRQVEYDRVYKEASAEYARDDIVKAEEEFKKCLDLATAVGNQQGIANSLNNLGVVCYTLGRLDKALDYGNRSLAIRQKLGNQKDIAQSLSNLGYGYSELGQHDKALDYGNQSLAIRQKLGNQQDIAQSLSNLGYEYSNLGQLDKALDYGNRSLAIRQKLGNQKDIAQSLDNLAIVYYALGQFDKELDNSNRSLAIHQKLGNSKDIADSLFNLGVVYDAFGQFDKALDYGQQSLAIRRKFGNQQDIASSLSNLGFEYSELGSFDKALDYGNPSLAIRRKLGNQLDIAQSLNNLGAVYYRLGQFDKALGYYYESLAIRQKHGNQQDISQILNNLGNVYRELGQIAKALDYYSQSLAIWQKIGNQKDIASSLDNLGNAYYALGQFGIAFIYDNQALAIRQRLGNQLEIAQSLNDLGDVYSQIGQSDKALDYYNQSLAIYQKLGNQPDIALSLNNLGNVYYDLGHLDKALDYGNRSLAIKQKLGNQQDIAVSLNNLGYEYDGIGQFDKAADAYSRAEHAFEEVSLQVGDPSETGAFQSANQGSLYVRYARALDHQKKPEKALAQIERGRAQGLARQVEYNERELGKIFSAEDSKRLAETHSAAVAASKLLLTAKEKLERATETQKTFFSELVKEYEPHAAQAARVYELVKDDLYAKHPDFKNISGKKPPNADALQFLARHDPGILFLDYGQSDEGFVLMTLHDRDPIGFHEIKVKPDDLGKQVKSYLAAVKGSEQNERKLARQLYVTLLGSLRIDPKTTKRIVFVPDGAIQDLPLAALIDPEGKRLIERYAVSSTVSLGLLIGRSTKRQPSKGLLVVADPDGAGTSGFTSNAFGTYGPLNGARAEGQAVASLFRGSTQLIGPQAREAEVRKQAGQFAILHFACHGYLNSAQALESGMVMAPEPADSPDIGVLTASQVMGTPLSAQLAVLSACQTGEGIQSGGEGLMGLAWAFRAAGCPAVVASKWEVDDAATKRIMVSFYKHLKNHERKDDALQAAMLEEMRYPETHHAERGESLNGKGKGSGKRSNAYYWAAFQVIGDCKPLDAIPGE